MPDRVGRRIAVQAAAHAIQFPAALPLDALDAAMRCHALTAPDLCDAGSYFNALVIAAAEDARLVMPWMMPLDFVRWRYGLRPDEPARDALEWRDRAALVLQTNSDAWPHGDARLRDHLEAWTVELFELNGPAKSPVRVACGIVAAQRLSGSAADARRSITNSLGAR
jgi:hypothetical protein